MKPRAAVLVELPGLVPSRRHTGRMLLPDQNGLQETAQLQSVWADDTRRIEWLERMLVNCYLEE